MEITEAGWERRPLSPEELGPYGGFPRLSNGEKEALWGAYRAGAHERVPVTYGMNDRLLLQAPALNSTGLAYRAMFSDPAVMLAAQVRYQHLVRSRYALFHDADSGLPEQWKVPPFFHNVSEAAFFGCALQFRPGEVPDTVPAYAGARKRAIFDVDIDHPTEKGFFADGIALTHGMQEAAKGTSFLGRPIVVEPYLPLACDGPLTVAMNVRGPEILTDLFDDPQYVRDLLDFIVTAAARRSRAMRAYWGVAEKPGELLEFADDSIALLSTEQYRESILPSHRAWYETMDPNGSRKRAIHLCGNAQRHFATIHEELGVSRFDTGFPIDFPLLREELGAEVEVLGGVEVATLLAGAPQAVYRRAREILASGVLRGGRFILREANNLPPRTPWANLAALYSAAFDHGRP